MDTRTRRRTARLLGVALLLSLFTLGTVGCEKSNEERLLTAKTAVLNKKPDVAQSHLEAVLKAEPKNFEAKRLSAAVEQLRGDFAEAEKKFLALQKAEGFEIPAAADPAEEGAKLSAEQKSRRELLKRDLLELYQEWAASLEPAEDMETFEKVVQKGLAISPKRPRLNTMLVHAYEAHAKKLVEQGKKLEAAKTYEKIPALYTNSATRSRVSQRASNLRFEAGRDQMLAYFNETAKPKLLAEERYDAEKKLITFSVTQKISEVEKYLSEKQNARVRLDGRREQVQEVVRQYAIAQKLRPALVEVVAGATGISKDADFSKVKPPETFNIVSAKPTRHDYTLTATIPLDAVLKIGFDVGEQTRLAAEKEAEKKAGAKAQGDAQEPEGQQDGEASAKAAAAEQAPTE